MIPIFIGLGELIVIMLVAFLILGPESMLTTARFMARIYRSIQRLILDIRSSISLTEFDGNKGNPVGDDEKETPAG